MTVPPVPLFKEPVAPTLVEQPTSNQLTFHLTEFSADFSSLGSILSPLFKLIFCILSMTKISSWDPCTPHLGSRSATRPTMEPASSIFFICRALTWGPLAGFCAASFPWPIRTKPPLYANRNVIFNKHKRTQITGYHYSTNHSCLRGICHQQRWNGEFCIW